MAVPTYKTMPLKCEDNPNGDLETLENVYLSLITSSVVRSLKKKQPY